MGFIKKMEEWENKLDDSMKKDKEKYKKDKAEAVAKAQAKLDAYNEERANTSQGEKFAKEGRFLLKAGSFWLLIPFLTVMACLGLIAIVALLDWIGIM